MGLRFNEIYKYADETLQTVQQTILANQNNVDIVNSFVSTLESQLPKNLSNTDSLVNSCKDQILKRLANSTLVNQNTFKTSANKLINTTLDTIFQSDSVYARVKSVLRAELSSEPTVNQLMSKIENLKSKILSSMEGNIDSFLNNNIINFSGQLLNLVSKNMNVAEKLRDFSSLSSLTSGLENGLLSTLQSNIQSILNSVTGDSQLANAIGSMFSIVLDGNKLNELTNLGNNILGNLKSLTNFATSNIQNAILPARQMLGGLESSISNIAELGKDIGSTNPLRRAATKTLANANNAVNNTGTSTNPTTTNPSANSTETKQSPSQDSPTDTTTNGMNNSESNTRKSQQAQESKNNQSTNSTTQNRKANMDSASTPSKDNTPELEHYDNSIPPRAQGSKDPRRDNCQELVLWETDKEHYVLLRDAKGNYILFDEDKNLIRIQHVSGSYIQIADNIDIEAAANVHINCAGPSYVKQF